jgi:hypothetical protein
MLFRQYSSDFFNLVTGIKKLKIFYEYGWIFLLIVLTVLDFLNLPWVNSINILHNPVLVPHFFVCQPYYPPPPKKKACWFLNFRPSWLCPPLKAWRHSLTIPCSMFCLTFNFNFPNYSNKFNVQIESTQQHNFQLKYIRTIIFQLSNQHFQFGPFLFLSWIAFVSVKSTNVKTRKGPFK